ncbi:MAG: hypothetical protein LBU36_03155 [Clostridiales bacterium]|jgi:hypothetical protein|nr:hypothetical protein [Clostridiales bacterium]
MADKRLYEMDYVYIPEGTANFEQTRIILSVSEGGVLNLLIQSDKPIAEIDAAGIVHSLQEAQFNKLKEDIIKDGKVTLEAAGKRCRVKFDADPCRYKEL